MSPTKEVRYTSHSVSPSPRGRSRSVSPSPRRRSRSRSFSRDRSRSRSRSRERGAPNPGNNLFVTGLSTRVTSSDLEKYFSKEGKVVDCEVIRDPRTRESRGFGFVTMETLGDANRCVRYLDRSVLEGRLITVQKVWCISTELTIYASNSLYSPFSTCALHRHLNLVNSNQRIVYPAKRKRGRTPTPGQYRGARDGRDRDRRRSRSYSPHRRRDRGRSRSRDRRDRSYSPYRKDVRRRERSLSAGGSGNRSD